MNKGIVLLCVLILSSASLIAGGGPCTFTFNTVTVDSVSCYGGSDGQIEVFVSGGTGPFTYSNGTSSTGPALTVLQQFNTDVVSNSGNPTNVYYSPSSCTPGSYFNYAAGVGCTGGAAYYSGSGTGGYSGCYLRTPQANATGLNSVTLKFDLTNSYNSSRPLDKITFSIWINNGYRNTSVVPVTVNGVATNEIAFTQSRSCYAVEVVFDISSATLTNKSDMLLYINSQCGYSTCNPYAVTIDNAEVLEGGGGSGFQSSNTFSGLPAGNYTITVEDGNGCQATYPGNPVVVGEPTVLTCSMGMMQPTVHGGSDGKAWLTASGGTPPYSYIWSGGVTSGGSGDTIINLTAGTYFGTVVDANGCTCSSSIFVPQPPCSLAVTNVVALPVSCHGGSNGYVEITASGGLTPYQYSIDNGSNYVGSNTFSNLIAGNLNIRVQDAGGCTAVYGSNPVNISPQAAPLGLVMDGLSPTTVGGSDGEAWGIPSGGTPGYTYAWSGGTPNGGGDTVKNLGLGTYCLTVTDMNGCSISGCYTVTNPPCGVTMTIGGSDVSCNNGTNGELVITPLGGTAPYQYSIDNGVTFSSTDTFSNLSPGTYDVVVEDLTGCQATAGVTLVNPPVLAISNTIITPVSVAGGNDGAIDITVTGGTSPWFYSWSAGQNTQDINGLTAGNYCVTFIDSKGCQLVDCFTVSQPGCNLLLSTTLLDPQCNGSRDGRITITISQGVPPFQYSVDGGANYQSSNSFAGMDEGTYTVVVVDGNSCSDTISVTLTDPAILAVTGAAMPESSAGANDGTVQTTVTGGSIPYAYQWSNSAITEDLANLGPGTYCVTVTDAHNCTVADCFTVGGSNPCAGFSITGVQATALLCPNESGNITISISGGQNPVLYSIDSGATFQNGVSVFTVGAGSYNVLVRDDNGCEVTYSNNPVVIQAVAALNPVISHVPGTGFYINDDFADYQWLFNNSPVPGAIDTSLPESSAGAYAVEVTDSNGCKDTSNVITVTGFAEYGLLTGVEVFPNPVTNVLTIRNNNGLSLDVTLTDLQGRKMMAAKLDKGTARLDVTHLAPGLYLLQIDSRTEMQVRKLIVE